MKPIKTSTYSDKPAKPEFTEEDMQRIAENIYYPTTVAEWLICFGIIALGVGFVTLVVLV